MPTKKKALPTYERVPFLNIDSVLGKPKNRVRKMGVELEGGWVIGNLPSGVPQLERDSSVFKGSGTDDGAFGRSKFPEFQFGEIPSGKIQPISLKKTLEKLYPAMINDTCGMHVHMSFENILQYQLLSDSPAYMETVIEYLGRWAKEESLPVDHPIWDRLAGKNSFCEIKFWPQAQISSTTKGYNHNGAHRYTFIHYCWRKETVECRGLPMMDNPQLAFRAISRLLDITNAYLVTASKGRVQEKYIVGGALRETTISFELKKGQVFESFTEG